MAVFGEYKIIKKCKTTNARVSEFTLKSNTIHLPIFMPVATYGAMRGVKGTSMPEEIILSNTYHLRNLHKNIKEFMRWKGSMLTDSGGFQIQSLPDVQVIDEGIMFYKKLFTPEDSMDTQMVLGADIMMQLDDVVNPMEDRTRHELAVVRSTEWLDRAITHINERSREGGNEKKKVKRLESIKIVNDQVLFPIIQGGLHEDLRMQSIEKILERKPVGIAIGGLSGGEKKEDFSRIVHFCCENLPDGVPRYVMGVGYPEDVVLCSALGTDMSDCVYPTRTARFGRAFLDSGDLSIDNKLMGDMTPIDPSCLCSTCKKHSRSFLVTIKGSSNFCMLMSIHNMHYMRELTRRIRESIMEDKFPEFIKEFIKKRFKEDIPQWIIYALLKVNISI
ncbi:Queuine tRNA-ribosyltransferase catalytic subunit 1 [Glugoides intestinalis]